MGCYDEIVNSLISQFLNSLKNITGNKRTINMMMIMLMRKKKKNIWDDENCKCDVVALLKMPQ